MDYEQNGSGGGSSISGGFISYSPHCWKTVNSSPCTQADDSVLAVSGNHTKEEERGGNAPSLTLFFSFFFQSSEKKASFCKEEMKGNRRKGNDRKKKKIREADTIHPSSSL